MASIDDLSRHLAPATRWVGSRAEWRETVVGLAVAGAGGALFFALGIPAPWISGAMIAVATAALFGLPVGVVAWMRNLALLGLGFSLGAKVTPAALEKITLWPMSLVMLAACVVTTVLAMRLFLIRALRWDAASASFAVIPGAFSYVMLLTVGSRADTGRVGVVQVMRLLVLSVALPPLIAALEPAAAASPAAVAPQAPLLELLVAVAACAAAGALFARLNVPAGVLIGAMVGSAVLHAPGITAVEIPPAALIPGYVIAGCYIGARFRGMDRRLLARTAFAGVATVVVALGISGLFAAAAAWALDLPFGQVWLAYVPGSLEVMVILSLALDLDPAFVGAHHVLRFLALTVVAPIWLRRHLN